ncbi:hypothetical protein RND81_10G120300 [Saponaria officinalis]|uniref:Uncharacterized protein n=1 Tax=Saponaria officinalis TaxID=3572 RepID=A0AAW1I236_SAPOF
MIKNKIRHRNRGVTQGCEIERRRIAVVFLLVLKDHERAYFDSADWALGKQGVEKPKGPLEGLQPKLQVCLIPSYLRILVHYIHLQTRCLCSIKMLSNASYMFHTSSG